jgi:hypothetical protein
MSEENYLTCPKCLAQTGDSWSNCIGLCPMEMSPYYDKKESSLWQKNIRLDQEEIERIETFRALKSRLLKNGLMISNNSEIFMPKDIGKIEKIKMAKYVIDCEYRGHQTAVFYADDPHPVSKSRYFALYYSYVMEDKPNLMITDGSFIEFQKIMAAVSDDEEIIFSRHRHDFVKSKDGSVFIDGGRDYIRTNTIRLIPLIIRGGEIRIGDFLYR